MANPQYCPWIEPEEDGRRSGTAELGNGDERAQLPAIGSELALSGSDHGVPVPKTP